MSDCKPLADSLEILRDRAAFDAANRTIGYETIAQATATLREIRGWILQLKGNVTDVPWGRTKLVMERNIAELLLLIGEEQP